MPHFKFDPMKELEYLSQRMRRIADDFPETFSFEFGKGFEPRIDVYSDSGNVRVVVELPGMSKDGVSLSVASGVLTLRGNKPAPEYGDGITVHRAERSFGEFVREIALPQDVDVAGVSATMIEGVLTIVLNKKAAPQDREINIDIQ
ncbi:MAG: Hsp20/alpha crystallin family protein [Bacteroidota bacterium]|jgi:HSP20 family protein|nr:Hsp20/alpha crystallin family protein [Bacteroidota bacterium]